MVFTLRLLHIFTVNKQLGPKIVIVNKMVRGSRPEWVGPEKGRGGGQGGVDSQVVSQGRRWGFGGRGVVRAGKGRAKFGLIFLSGR